MTFISNGMPVPNDTTGANRTNGGEIITITGPQRLYAMGERVQFLYRVLDGTVVEQRTTNQTPNTQTTLAREITSSAVNNRTSKTILGIYDLLYFGAQHSTSADILLNSTVTLQRIDASNLVSQVQMSPMAAQSLAPLSLIEDLRIIPFLQQLSSNPQIERIMRGFMADCCEAIDYDENSELYSSIEGTEWFYFIRKGQVQLTWDSGRPPMLLANGAAFGFTEVDQQGQPIAHSAHALSELSIYRIRRKDFRQIVGAQHPLDSVGRRLLTVLQQTLASPALNPFFGSLSQQERSDLSGYVSHYVIPHVYFVLRRGESIDTPWILMRDQLAQVHAVGQDGEPLQPVGVSGVTMFGQEGFEHRHQSLVGVEAAPGSQWLRFHKLDLEIMADRAGKSLSELLGDSALLSQLPEQSRRRNRLDLQEEEHVEVQSRQHWIVLLWKLLPSIVMLTLLFIFSLLVAIGVIEPVQWQTWLVLFGSLAAIPQICWGLIDYLNDYLVVTNRHVIVQEEVLFFKHHRLEASLEEIQNVEVASGFVGTLLQYGTIVVSTAGTEGSIPFTFMPYPDAVRNTIFEMQRRRREEVRAANESMSQQMLNERLLLELPFATRVLSDRPLQTLATAWFTRLWKWLRRSAGQSAKAENMMIWRKHWSILALKLIAPVTILTFILLAAVGQWFAWVATLRELFLFLDLLLAIVGIADLIWIAWIVADWRNDTYEVTDRTITDVERTPLGISDNTRTAELDRIQNITTDIPSFIHYLLNFGDVHLQTAATEGDFTFDSVPDPRGVAAEIQRRKEQFLERRREAEVRQRAQEMPTWFDTYDLIGGSRKRTTRPPL